MNTSDHGLNSSVVMRVDGLSKGFTLHLHGGQHMPVVNNVGFELSAGECLVLGGPSGAGKSSILKMLYGNYETSEGRIIIQHHDGEIDLASADARTIIDIRRRTLGYVSQFLRVIPRVSALDVVAEMAMASGMRLEAARKKAADLLAMLNLPERLWALPPATFSGGEQQRVNIARGFAGSHSILILDEPTASLDAGNRDAFVALMQQRKQDGTAFIGIFHDEDMRQRLADRIIDITAFRTLEAA